MATPVSAPKTLGIDLDSYTTAAAHELGEICFGKNGKIFRYVQFLDAVTYAAGQVVTQGTTGTDVWKVTNDRAGGSNVAGHSVIGVLVTDGTVPTQNQYGWVQIAGECTPLGTYAAGDYVIPHATTDGHAVVSAYGVADAAASKLAMNVFGKALSSTRVKLTGLV